MDSSDVSLIRPVSGLQKTAGVSKTGPREERRRQPSRDQSHGEARNGNELTEPETEVSRPACSADDPHTIDFRA
jgi:hypothetical protein